MWPVSSRPAQPVDRPRTALILVRNTVSHDNRVLREVQTLWGAGFSVLVAGVVSTSAPERRTRVAGVDVIRLDPLSGLRRAGRARQAPRPGAAGGAPQPLAGAHIRRRARRALTRVAATAGYYARGTALCWRMRPALVHANDYNTMWIALAAKLLCGSRIVYDCHELWPDRNGRPEWRPWLLACEMSFVRAADATITASPGYADAIARRYRVPRPAVIRNIPAVDGARARERGAAPDEPLAIYLGGVMPGRGLEEGIEALVRVPELRLRLVGPGRDTYRDSLLRLAERRGVASRVQLRPAVAPADVVAAIAPATFGLMLIQPVCRSYELTLPNKLFEYAAAGVPMLAADLEVIGRMVREHGLGEAVPPGDVAQIAAAMRRLIEPGRNHELRVSVRSFAQADPWEREREALAAVYETTVPRE